MTDQMPPLLVRGVKVFETLLAVSEQQQMLNDIRHLVSQAPLFSPMTPYGKPMSVQMTSAGKYGWISDTSGYSYARTHPNGTAWPAIPDSILNIWAQVSGTDRSPDCCLINFYREGAKMGMHQDRDEASFDFPVVSISLGDDARFRVGHTTKGGTTETVMLRSGDVAMMGNDARLVYHGVDRIDFGTSTLLKQGGRINLTLRVVD